LASSAKIKAKYTDIKLLVSLEFDIFRVQLKFDFRIRPLGS